MTAVLPEPTDVVLVTMPYLQVMRPSIALGILKECLRRDGISCRVDYANLHFVEAIGLDVNSLMMQLRTDSLLGEWTFAEAAFRDGRDTLDFVLGRARMIQPANLPAAALDDRQYATLLRQLRAFAPQFVDETARRILRHSPRIVGATSTFEQHCAALAVLRRVKELDPKAVTLLGGGNCEMEMGWTTLKNCEWVDYVVSGEADELIGPLCREILGSVGEVGRARLPEGVMSREHVRLGRRASFAAGKLPRAVVAKMSASPAPDFDDYFETLKGCEIAASIIPALAVESSRGCWWGQKSHCTFCGLNGSGMNYRAKDSAVVAEEFADLTTRYSTRKLMVVDNIIDLKHVRELLPMLEAAGAPYEMFYETKANLRREQVRQMADAGVTKIQPGIEALHDDLLKLMAKGNSTTINVRLLRYARDYGLSTVWLLLVGFPREDPAWHREVARWIPLVSHLQPPNGIAHVRYDRFSVYFEQAESYALDLQPFVAYGAVYPFSEEDLQDLAYFFYDANQAQRGEVVPEVLELAAQVKAWIVWFNRPVRPVFCCDDDGERLQFFDTRIGALERRVELGGLTREVYLACDDGIGRRSVVAKFTTAEGGVAEAEVEAAIRELIDRRLVLAVHDRLLSLACRSNAPGLPDHRDSPSGYVEKYDETESKSATAAWAGLRTGSRRLAAVLDQADSTEVL